MWSLWRRIAHTLTRTPPATMHFIKRILVLVCLVAIVAQAAPAPQGDITVNASGLMKATLLASKIQMLGGPPDEGVEKATAELEDLFIHEKVQLP
jgi:hypothetical protein